MIAIKGGQYQLGCQLDDKNCELDEAPYTLKLTPFLIAKYPVTNSDYVRFLNAKHRHTNVLGKYWIQLKNEDADSHLLYKKGIYTVEQGYELYPVIEVSWVGAMQYAQWLSETTTVPYRLPTDAEWEAMARIGGDISCIDEPHCTKVQSLLASRKGLKSIGSGLKNTLGINDIMGNTWEWTCSHYHKNNIKYQSRCAKASPRDSYGSIRGCSWQSNLWECRFSNRAYQSVWHQNHQTSFRLATDHI